MVTGTRLHLIEPLGFSLAEKDLKRAGLDYWKDLDVTVYSDYQDFSEPKSGSEGLLCVYEGAAYLYGGCLRAG